MGVRGAQAYVLGVITPSVTITALTPSPKKTTGCFDQPVPEEYKSAASISGTESTQFFCLHSSKPLGCVVLGLDRFFCSTSVVGIWLASHLSHP
eukprot:3931489-Amphidinium_carterae.1